MGAAAFSYKDGCGDVGDAPRPQTDPKATMTKFNG